MKKTALQVLVGARGRERPHETTGYQVEGHLHVCRDPRGADYWVIVHAPTGLRLNERAVGQMPFRTRRRAAAVAADLGDQVPELTTRPRIKTFIRRNKRHVRQCFTWACLRHIGT